MEYAIDKLEDLGLRKLAIMNIEKEEEIERLNNIIKEVREYIEERYNGEVLTHTFDKDNVGELLEILDKAGDEISK